MKVIGKIFLGLLCLLAGMVQAQEYGQEPHFSLDELACMESHRYLFDQTLETTSQSGKNFNSIHCRMEWYLHPARQFIAGKVTHSFIYTDTASIIVFDLAQNLTVDSVYYHNQRLHTIAHNGGFLRITLPQVFTPGLRDSVSIFYKGAPLSSGFGSFFRSTHAGVPVLWTLSQPYGAKDWWPCKNTLTDKIDSIDVYITTPQQYVGVSNGVLMGVYAADTFKTYHWRHRYPITSYLVAVAVTNYTRYTDKVPVPGQDSLIVWNYVYPENLNQVRQSTRNVVRMIQFFDSLFIRYPFHKEQYGHAQFSWGGGMEHQTMSFMGSFGFDLMAHELAHQWFGDYITCRSFKEIWLNEGFATYLNALANERFNPGIFNTWKQNTQNAIMSQPGGSIMVDDTLSVARIFDGRLTYQKGAYFLHMLRWHLGDSAFFSAIRNYLNDDVVRYGYATTAQLKAHFEAASGQQLDYYFTNWYERQGYPNINYLCESFDDGTVRFTLSQSTSHPSVSFFPIKIPFRLQTLQHDTTVAVWHTANGQVVELNIGFQPTQVTFDPQRWLIARGNGSIITHNNPAHLAVDKIEIYPNPAHNKLYIKGLSTGHQHHLQLLEPSGKAVWQAILDNSSETIIDLTTLQQGLYLIVIDHQKPQKIIVTH